MTTPAAPPAAPPVILVDDEPEILFSASALLESHGVGPVIGCQDGRELPGLLANQGARAVVLDLIMPMVSGTDLLKGLSRDHPDIPVLVMTAVQKIDVAVQCMKDGAFDYLVKPVEESRFVSAVSRALELTALKRQVGDLQARLTSDRLAHEEAFAPILTRNKRMRGLFQYIEAVGPSAEPALITGETGVGKELAARALHQVSGRAGKLVALNVAGLDEMTFSDTLFGHRKGAFTGAHDHRPGLIAEAAGGSLFLDEIGDLPPGLQVKLLRLIQERQYFPLGSDLPRAADLRIICATNRDLKALTGSGKFRKDLFYRLSGHGIEMPPLRERREDLPLLVDFFLEEAAGALNKKKPTPPPELFQLLGVHPFPGNVRELRAMVHDAVARHRSGVLSLARFKEAIGPRSTTPPADLSHPEQERHNPYRLFSDPLPTFEQSEHCLIEEALRRSGGNQTYAAALLGITRQTLIRRLRKARQDD